jgi:predicted permease
MRALAFASGLRPALRTLARRPLDSGLAVATLALGLAASTAAFVLLHSTFVQPLPFAEPDRLATVDVTSPRGFGISISVPNFRDWSGRASVLAPACGEAPWGVVLGGRGAARPARALEARQLLGDCFALLGIEAALGRTFAAAETERGAEPLAVLSHGLWQELGAEPGILGSALTLDGRPHTVVGVLPRGIGYPTPETQVYLPLGALADLPWEDRGSSFGMRLHGRLRPGVTWAQAQAELERVTAIVRAEEGREVAQPRLRSLADHLVGDLEAPLALVAAAAAVLVALALANVIGLFVARGEGRRSELAVRAALGAPRGDLVRLQLAEAVWLALAGGLLGLGAAAAVLRLLAGRLADELPAFVAGRLELGWPGAAFALGLLGVTLAVLAVLPAMALPRAGAAEALSGPRGGVSRRARRLRSALVVGELALGTALLVGASLLVGSLGRLSRVDKGFDERGVVAGRLSAPDGHFADAASWLDFHRRLRERAAGLPGARSAALALLLPLGRSWERGIVPEGRPVEPGGGDSVLFNVVSPEYFSTLGVEIVRGRNFGPGDRDGAELVAIVDESLAERYWPGEDPLGRRVTFESDGDPHAAHAASGEAPRPVYRAVVGVARNLRHYELQSPSRIQVYVPLEQTRGLWGLDLELLVAASGPLTPLVAGLPRLLAELDPEVPLRNAEPLAARVDRALARPRLLGASVAAIGALALLLAGVGVFALASYSVSRRRLEFGLRQALGATPAAVLREVLRQALGWGAVAAAGGLPLAALGARLARSLLFGVGPLAPGAYLFAAATLVGVTLLACLAPAVSAMRVEPARVLRDQA